MVTVNFLGPAAEDFPEAFCLEAHSLAELASVLNDDELAAKWLKISAVAVNGHIASNAQMPLKTGDLVQILPPVCGG